VFESFACDARETVARDHRGSRFEATHLCIESATQVLLGLASGVLLLLAPAWSLAGNLTVTVTDRNGAAVAETAVTVSELNKAADTTTKHKTETRFVMDQLGMRFVPELLVVPVGSTVNFPNSDSVSHQVYSFSKAKRFQLSLYKGTVHPPVQFDTPGLVVMGCNIHDQMAGYIYVTDARWYGKTDSQGKVVLEDVPATDVEVTIWNPRIADAHEKLTRPVKVSDASQSVEFRLGKTLRSLPEPRPRNPGWDY
jgi:plastocyanin